MCTLQAKNRKLFFSSGALCRQSRFEDAAVAAVSSPYFDLTRSSFLKQGWKGSFGCYSFAPDRSSLWACCPKESCKIILTVPPFWQERPALFNLSVSFAQRADQRAANATPCSRPGLDVCAALADEAANRSFGQSELRPGEAWPRHGHSHSTTLKPHAISQMVSQRNCIHHTLDDEETGDES